MTEQPVKLRGGARHITGKFDTSTDEILSPKDLQELAQKGGRKVPGSKRHDSAWRKWCAYAVNSIRYHLVLNLQEIADPEAFGKLFFNLATAADRGEMPSFACPKARAGYTIEFMCRANLIADLFLAKYSQPTPNDVFASKYSVQESRAQKVKPCRILSLGGGPGYDYLGILMADTFGSCGNGTTRLEGIVFDYEEGWQDLVEAMNNATQLAFVNDNGSCLKWGGGCDIAKPLSDPSNNACRAEVGISDVIVCQYCVAENAARLRESDFIFFGDIFEQAKNESFIVITEVTPRLWPEVVDVLLRRSGGGNGFSIDFFRSIKRSVGPQLVIQKRQGYKVSRDELVACDEFRRLQELHQRKIQNGFQRQPRKLRGSK